MKLYVCTPSQDVDFAFERRKIVEEVLRPYRASIVDSSMRDPKQSQSVLPMRSVHGFVLDSRCDQSELAYVLAFAVVQKKPVFYIASAKADMTDLYEFLGKDRIPESIIVDDGMLDGLHQRVQKFVDKHVVAQASGDDVASLKFTLRITPKLDRFLQSQIKNTTISKADYMRNLVVREMEKEEKDKQSKKNLKTTRK